MNNFFRAKKNLKIPSEYNCKIQESERLSQECHEAKKIGNKNLEKNIEEILKDKGLPKIIKNI